jgi:AraC-like DNA-binding protein
MRVKLRRCYGRRVDLRVDRDAEASDRVRVYAQPAIVAPLETTVATLHIAGTEHRLDRATFALIPARASHSLELPVIGASIVATLVIDEDARAAAVHDYAPYVDARRMIEVMSAPRILPRTRWIDELVQRYVFEREVCERPTSKAARFLEAELSKEVYFLGHEQLEQSTRSSVVFEGGTLAVRARAWLEEHLFEPFAIAALVAHCHASESTVLRAFRKELGAAPLAYLRRRRLEEALQLLQSGRYAVTEVATRVGYENPSAFAAAFREQFGVAPSRARAQVQPTTLPAHGKPPRRSRRRA